jgi:hypothetical protein
MSPEIIVDLTKGLFEQVGRNADRADARPQGGGRDNSPMEYRQARDVKESRDREYAGRADDEVPDDDDLVATESYIPPKYLSPPEDELPTEWEEEQQADPPKPADPDDAPVFHPILQAVWRNKMHIKVGGRVFTTTPEELSHYAKEFRSWIHVADRIQS